MYKNFIKPFGLLALLTIAGFFTACQKDEVASDVDNFVQLSTRGIESRFGVGFTGCYELVFPVTVQFSDSTTADVSDYAGLKQAIRDWFVANGGPKHAGRPTLLFPIQVLNEKGEVIDVASQEALRDLIALCKPVNGGGHHGGGSDTINGGHHGGGPDTLGGGHHDGGHHGGGHGNGGHGDGPCYTLVFPVTVSFSDSTQVTVNSQEELGQATRDWNKDHPGQHARPELVFPITVTLKDGTVADVKSKEELRAIKEACRG